MNRTYATKASSGSSELVHPCVCKNCGTELKVSNNKAKPIKNAIGLKPTGGGYKKIKGAVSG